MEDTRVAADGITQATVSVAWVIIANKPLYPVYVWYLTADGVKASLMTLLSIPFFIIIPLLARRSPFAARMAFVLVGTLDTLFETKLYGHDSGTELFYAACMMLAALSFCAAEKWWRRGMIAFVFVVFIFSRNWIGIPLYIWSDGDLSRLLNLNAFSVACLMAFIALRYPDRDGSHQRPNSS